jgi:anti-sigma regulatory factor (Ser/Thr protein kinase)
MKEVRRSVSALRADTQENQPLEEVIKSLIEDFRQGTGISTSTKINLSTPVPPQVVKTLYRIVQEALTNICKHAQATEVRIQLNATLERVCLIVVDNGRGFRLEQNKTGFGLQSMRERVAAANGYFHLESDLGTGCRITVELPLLEGSTGWQHPALSKSFVQLCERELTDLIGPLAPFLVQRALNCSPRLSPKELVEAVVVNIADFQKATEFRQRLYSETRRD